MRLFSHSDGFRIHATKLLRTDIYLGLASVSMFKRAIYMIGGLLHDVVSMQSKGVIEDGGKL